jgi:hypothetical protein
MPSLSCGSNSPYLMAFAVDFLLPPSFVQKAKQVVMYYIWRELRQDSNSKKIKEYISRY